MYALRNQNLVRFAFALVLILTLIFGALGRRQAVSADDLALEAYVLAGGSIAEICGDDPSRAALFHGCPLCCLTGFAVLPDLATRFVAQERSYVMRRVVPQIVRALRAPLDPAHGAQAPPILLI